MRPNGVLLVNQCMQFEYRRVSYFSIAWGLSAGLMADPAFLLARSLAEISSYLPTSIGYTVVRGGERAFAVSASVEKAIQYMLLF